MAQSFGDGKSTNQSASIEKRTIHQAKLKQESMAARVHGTHGVTVTVTSSSAHSAPSEACQRNT
jgi:hypothetical protein